jgi:hypothetical protein
VAFGSPMHTIPEIWCGDDHLQSPPASPWIYRDCSNISEDPFVVTSLQVECEQGMGTYGSDGPYEEQGRFPHHHLADVGLAFYYGFCISKLIWLAMR